MAELRKKYHFTKYQDSQKKCVRSDQGTCPR